MEQTVNMKALKFRAQAERRVTVAIKTLRRIGELSRRQTYDYTPEQIEKMFAAIRTEVDDAHSKFTEPDKRQGSLFRLD